jgi:hypothetical protein
MNSHDKILQYMGYEDSVFNHLLLVQDIKENKISQEEIERRADHSFLSRRVFTVQCLNSMECLCLSFSDLDIIKRDYQT